MAYKYNGKSVELVDVVGDICVIKCDGVVMAASVRDLEEVAPEKQNDTAPRRGRKKTSA